MRDKKKVEEDHKYKDYDPDGLGDLKEIKRIRNMPAVAPSIAWGKDYLSWTVDEKLKFAERLACTMNHAADLMQQERNELLVRVKELETALEQNQGLYLKQGDFVHSQLQKENVEKQDLYAQIVALKAENRQMKFQLEQIEKKSRGG